MPRSRLLCAIALAAMAARATAMTVVPLSIADLTQSSAATVLATVEDVQVELVGDGHLRTLVRISIEQVIAGYLTDSELTLVEAGGVLDDDAEIIDAAPQFVAGERVVLFLARRTDGTWRTNHMLLGKFHIEGTDSGSARALQPLPSNTTVLLPPGVSAPNPVLPFDTLMESIRSAAAGFPVASVTAANTDSGYSAAFTLAVVNNQNGRFFDPDEGKPLSFLIDQSGDATLGLTVSRRAVDAAFSAWSNVDTATIELHDGGLTSDLSPACPGPNPLVVRFDDPLAEIPDPVGCHGMLAVGGFRARTSETKVFGGANFAHSLCATLTFANGWGGCDVWTECNFGEIATHELGHAIGLGHSSERNPEPDATLRDATMYFQAHFDGRCASVRSDDIAGVSFIYPLATPPTITTSDTLPPGSEGQPYSLQLTAMGGSGSFVWSLTRQTNVSGLAVSSDGMLSGSPVTAGSGTKSLLIRAGDTNGDAHTKLFTLVLFTPPPSPTASQTGTPTQTLVPSATPTVTDTPPPSLTPSPTEVLPTATPTPTSTDSPTPTVTPIPSASPTATAPPCPGDCDGSGDVTVDELIKLVNVALGSAPISACPTADRDQSGDITIDEIIAAVNEALDGCPISGSPDEHGLRSTEHG